MIENANGRVTLAQLVTIVCGGKGQYSIVGGGRKSMSASLDVDQVAGGRVDLSKDVCITSLLIQMHAHTLCTRILKYYAYTFSRKDISRKS